MQYRHIGALHDEVWSFPHYHRRKRGRIKPALPEHSLLCDAVTASKPMKPNITNCPDYRAHDNALRADTQPVTNTTVGQRFDTWCAALREQVPQEHESASERRCLSHFLHVTDNMRPQLIKCYDDIHYRTENLC